jgi:murein DD-endopeptidase MepM/ murein hydrolase activator NlpD
VADTPIFRLTVQAYSGEQGSGLCGHSGEPCGRYNQNFLPPLNGQSNLHFFVNGNYVGTGADGSDQEKVLNYRGHSGIDYRYDAGTQIYAAHEGDLFMPSVDPILGSTTKFNTFYIVDASGWSTWYLHTEVGSITTASPVCSVRLSNGDRCVGHVHRGTPIAKVGDTGVPSPHLHFEVRAACDFGATLLAGCKVVDPYGWEWAGSDPIAVNNPRQAMSHPAPLWDLSTWNLTQPQVSSAVVSPAGNVWTMTIEGSQFDTVNPIVTLWHARNLYCFACGDPQSPATISIQSKSTTQIVTQVHIVDPAVSLSPDVAVVKVSNGSNGPGPRSPGKQLSVLANAMPGPTSYSLLLYKTPAPGGGVFLGFAGFHSATEDGHVIFNSGVDTNGDNVPDFFADFDYGPAGPSQVAFSGFTQVLSTLMNGEGDRAFSAVNQAAGRTAAGIYLLQAGTTSPVKVAQPGDTCPSPCPVLGPSFINVAGPFAIGEAGEVVFSAELNGPSPTPTWVLYLFNPGDGSYTKIAADGTGGDVTPVGGVFTSQNFFGSVGIVPATGDVIFSDLVTNGTSAGGLFKFSRTTKKLSKLVAQGDSAPAGVTGTLGIPLGSVAGQYLAFYASVTGGSTTQIIGLVPDTTATVPTTKLVAFAGEATGTVAGGKFATPANDPPLPFAFFGQGQGAPLTRKDGSVVFSSVLAGASSASGSPTDQGIFFWNGTTITKIVVDGDPLSNGKSVQGVVQFTVNNLGNIYYFATTEN